MTDVFVGIGLCTTIRMVNYRWGRGLRKMV